MSKSHSKNVNGIHDQFLSNIESILILERSLDCSGQQYVENLNIIENFLLKVVEQIGNQESELEATFILRRLPSFTAPFINKNEYAVVLDNFDFTLTVSSDSRRRSTTDKVGTSNFGQIEIFYPEKNSRSNPLHTQKENTEDGYEIKSNKLEAFVNENGAYCSHEVFKKFAAAFLECSNSDLIESVNLSGSIIPRKKVQLIGPHLLHDLKCSQEVSKIFTVTQPNIQLNDTRTSKCVVSVNHLKSLITIVFEDTEVTVKPCLFNEKGFSRVNTNLLERIPLYHSSILNIGESLNKGCLLFPTSFETLWTLQFWPSESHIISTFHPNSIISRLFKIHGAFCLNPINFWEALNNNFLVCTEDMDSLTEQQTNYLTIDFFASSFLHELENYSKIEDWAPRNFSFRFMHLLKISVDSYEKGFHSHYFTKINVLRGIWRNSCENFEKEKSILRELDDIEESPEDLEDYGEKSLDDFEDDFGFHFEALDIKDYDGPSPLTSNLLYKSNPFQSLENLPAGSKEVLTKDKKPKTLSKMFGSNIIRRFSSKLSRSKSDAGKPGSQNDLQKPKSMMDVACGFEESIAQMRREQTLQHLYPSEPIAETSFLHNRKKNRSCSVPQPGPSHSQVRLHYEDEGFQNHANSLYSNILQVFNEMPPSDHLSDPELIEYLDKHKKILESQEELIVSWCRIMDDIPKPKNICPHIFTPRQIQYISLIIQNVSRCSPNIIKTTKSSKLPSWEISGDILRTVLHQMRSEVPENDTAKEKQKPTKKFSFKSSKNLKTESPGSGRSVKFSFRKRASDVCKNHTGDNGEADPEGDTQLALEDPETAATNRLLHWLWQLRNSEIGRLSFKAKRYIEELYYTSLVSAHFLEQFLEERVFQTMAIRSAVAVTRIMADEKFPTHVPLLAASNKGWLWAEMVLSLAAWNREKGLVMKADVPLTDPDLEENNILREIDIMNLDTTTTLKKASSEPDTDAVTLAFHSELATPLGWNDFEDPRRPGPFTVPILIFSSLGYFKQWEMVPGNILQVLVRLQKFNSLQHVGSMLFPPHRKTALNEVRKLNKSLSFRSFQFDDNVMSKTFKRLASLRATRRLLLANSHKFETNRAKFYTCDDIGCSTNSENGTLTLTTCHDGREFDCTRL